MDHKDWAKGMAELIKSQLSVMAKTLGDRIDALEQIQPLKGDAGENCTQEQVDSSVEKYADPLLKKFFASISASFDELRKSFVPVDQHGVQEFAREFCGELLDQKFAKIDSEFSAAQEQIRKAIAEIKNGEDGKSVDIEDVLSHINSYVDKWALDFERRAQDLFIKAVEAIPKPQDGKPGIDGLGFDDLTIEHDENGFVKIKFMRGEQIKEFNLRFPVMLYRGVYDPKNSDYMQGHCVSYGGCMWVSKKDNPEISPAGEGNDCWQMAVKRGRKGLDLRDPLARPIIHGVKK